MTREIRWPAQERSIFWEDEELFGRTPDYTHVEAFFGNIQLVYGPVRASKTAMTLLTWSKLRYFEPSGFSSWCFIPNILKGHMKTAESRTGLEFQGNVRYVNRAEEILNVAGDRIKRAVILIPECMMLDSKIIEVSHELAKRGKAVLLDGLDLSYRGEYFPFQDYENGKTMADLIASVPPTQRFPQRSYCTATINDQDDRCRHAGRFTQRKFADDTHCPWHDELIKIRPYDERTKAGNADDNERDKYRVACADHLNVPYHEIPRFIRGIVGLERDVTASTVLGIAKRLKQDETIVQQTLERMLHEHQIEEDGRHLILPRRYAA